MTRSQQIAATIGSLLLVASLFAALEYTGILHHQGCCPCVQNVTP